MNRYDRGFLSIFYLNMEEIVKIHETKQGSRVVSARDLHEYLQSKQDFSDWIKKRIKKYDFKEGIDYTSFHKKMERDNGGTTRLEYAVSMDMAKELAMVEGNVQGKNARRYFIECENKLREQSAAPVFEIPQTLSQALLLAATQAAQIEDQQKQIKENEPKVKAANIMLMSDDGITVAEFAKSIGRGPNRLYKLMREDKYLIPSGNRHNLPYQKYIEAGYFAVKETTQVINNKVKLFHQTLVTPKGQVYLTSKYC